MKKLALIPLLMLLGACATSGSGYSSAAQPARASLGAGPLTSASLVGVAPAAISARLGEPDFRRDEPKAEVWQYSGGDCSLFVYFYKDDAGGLGSRYIDARRIEGGTANKDACLANVMARRNSPIS